MSRGPVGLLAVAAALTIVASCDSWFTTGPGFVGPDPTMAWVLDVAAAMVGLGAVAALVRRSAALEHLTALAGLLLCGALLMLLFVAGEGTDWPERGGWMAAVAAAMGGGSAVTLLSRGAPLGTRLRGAAVAFVVAVTVAAVTLPPDWSHPEVQIIR